MLPGSLPLPGGRRRVLLGSRALRQSETVSGWLGREELFLLPAGNVPLCDEPVHPGDVALRRAGGLRRWQRRARVPGRSATQSDHGGADRQSGVRLAARHRPRVCVQALLAQNEGVQVRRRLSIGGFPFMTFDAFIV